MPSWDYKGYVRGVVYRIARRTILIAEKLTLPQRFDALKVSAATVVSSSIDQTCMHLRDTLKAPNPLSLETSTRLKPALRGYNFSTRCKNLIR